MWVTKNSLVKSKEVNSRRINLFPYTDDRLQGLNPLHLLYLDSELIQY